MYGGAGADEFELFGTRAESGSRGGPGPDLFEVHGTTGTIRGAADADRIFVDPRGRVAGALVGGDGDDTVAAQNGAVDDIRCGPGQDTVHIDLDDAMSACEVVFHPDEGADTVRGGPGNDSVSDVGDGEVDLIRCGSGEDTVTAGPEDSVGGSCEHVTRRD